MALGVGVATGLFGVSIPILINGNVVVFFALDGTMGKELYRVGVAYFCGLQRVSRRGNGRGYSCITSIGINVNRGGGFIVTGLICVGVFNGANAGYCGGKD